MSHVFSWLVAPVWVQRRTTRDPQRQLGLDTTSPVIDRAAMVLTAVERSVVRHVPLPFGTSILAVMAKAQEVEAAEAVEEVEEVEAAEVGAAGTG